MSLMLHDEASGDGFPRLNGNNNVLGAFGAFNARGLFELESMPEGDGLETNGMDMDEKRPMGSMSPPTEAELKAEEDRGRRGRDGRVRGVEGKVEMDV